LSLILRLEVLLRWIAEERDSWLLRRSVLSWSILQAATEVHVLNELVYLRISGTSGTSGKKGLSKDEERVLKTLRELEGWTSPEELSNLKQPEKPEHSELATQELFEEQLRHRDYLKYMAESHELEWGQVTEGILNFRTLGGAASVQA